MNTHANIGLIEQVSAVLRDMLGDDFDPETFWDTLDGETDALDLIGHLIKDRVEAQAFEAASKEQASIWSDRARRMADKQKAVAKALGTILDATGERKVAHPLGTVSRIAGRLSLQIFDETAIPSQLCVTTVSPDKVAIKKQLEAGETVPGAVLVRGDDSVTVRVK